jgi:cysteine desulfurase/selenocysteine lyase
MRPHDDPGHLDFVTLSAHKLYAPFGSGALVGRRDGFGAAPDHRGGGTVDGVTLDDIAWAALPDREEAGTPNLFGAVAFAAATETLTEIGWDRIMAHETELLSHAMTGLAGLPGVRVYGPLGAAALGSKVGVIPFTIDGVDHGLVAAVLGFEHGISVRSGCFCAQPYIAHLLDLDSTETADRMERARDGDKRGSPGMVRISLGLGNDIADVDRVLDAVGKITDGDIGGRYCCDRHGDYHPID